MKTVWKYQLPPHPGFGVWIEEVEMPVGAWPISAALQAIPMSVPKAWPAPTRMTVWAQVESEEPLRQLRRIAVVGTGSEIPIDARFLSTVQDGPFVWHVFDLGEVTVTSRRPRGAA